MKVTEETLTLDTIAGKNRVNYKRRNRLELKTK